MMTHVPRELCCDESDGACACTSGILSGAGSSKLSLAACSSCTCSFDGGARR